MRGDFGGGGGAVWRWWCIGSKGAVLSGSEGMVQRWWRRRCGSHLSSLGGVHPGYQRPDPVVGETRSRGGWWISVVQRAAI